MTDRETLSTEHLSSAIDAARAGAEWAWTLIYDELAPSVLGWPLEAFAATATYLIMAVGFENAAADLDRGRI